MVSEKQLDKEDRRAWTGAAMVSGPVCCRLFGGGGGLSVTFLRRQCFQILLGESTSSDAWTDGETYIAYNIDIVRRLKPDALRTASLLFSLTEHEVAHEGDSLDCGP
ncbi:Uncharacterised protein [Enterobacter cloacae]|uniref:Uncharacterized protein n=1 Tax=Enterobacter cloacae TaxID=550 RepID=A0A377M814_ENTCL|nr:Uncharacterised protein [Enterobacter cloacae]